MTKKGCRAFVVLIILLFGTAVSFAESKIVVRVNGEALTNIQLERIIDELLPKAFYHGAITPEKREKYRPEALEELIKRELIYQAAKKQGYKIKSSEINDYVDNLIAKYKSESEFNKVLKANGYTMESFRKDVEKNKILIKFMNEEILEKAAVSDEFIRQYYEENKKDFLRPATVNMRHILIKVPPTVTGEAKEKLRKDTQNILDRALNGEDFGDLASQYSMDDYRVKGGYLPMIHKGRLEPQIEEVLFRLEEGQISNIIETLYGFHIVKLEKKMPPTQLPLNEVKHKLQNKLEGERKKDIENRIMLELRKNAKIEIIN